MRYHILAVLLAALLMTSATGAFAAEAPFVDGTYATKAGCDWLAKAQSARDPEKRPVTMERDGFWGLEWNCQFAQLVEHEKNAAWVAILFCEEPGYPYPDMAVIRRDGDGGFIVNFGSDQRKPSSTTYRKCKRTAGGGE